MGNYYRWGYGPVAKDPVRAHIWYSLAGATTVNISEMTPELIAEVEHLVAAWEPNPAERDTIGAQSEN